MQEMEAKLQVLQNDLTAFLAKAAAESKTHGDALTETKAAVAAIQKQIDAIDARLQRPAGGTGSKSLEVQLKENESVQRLFRDRRGSASITIEGAAADELLNRKTTITSTTVGWPTSGVMPEERAAFVVEARRALRMRSIIPARPTALGKIYWPKVNSALSDASPQSQGTAKTENAVTFTTATEDVKTIATWIPASKQVLDDWAELAGFLRTGLAYYVDKEEDDQILSGDNTFENLNGLTTQAQSFDTTLLASSYTKIDIVGTALQQIEEDNEIPGDWVVLNPRDLWGMKKLKDTTNRYILGDPNSAELPQVWGARLIPTTAMTAGYFLAGSSSPAAAEIRDRQGVTIDISTEHSDYFTKNLVAIRAEKRMALCVYRANAFVYGALANSPA